MILLYKMEGCPYCKKVIDFLEENKIEYKPIDISDSVNNDQLLQIGGKNQVPFITDTDNNVNMYESDEIIEYLKTI